MAMVETFLPPTRVSGCNVGNASLGQTCVASDSRLPSLAGPTCTQVWYLTFLHVYSIQYVAWTFYHLR